MQNNVVEYFSGHDGYRCGYCKSPDTNFSHGMWAHSITPAVYKDLLDRGWRRSGKYLYKPTNNRTCCPCYTISCHALDYHISKSQKKVLKKFNEYLQTGILKSQSSQSDVMESGDGATLEVVNYKRGAAGFGELDTLVPKVNPIHDTKVNGESESATCSNLSNPDSPKRWKSEGNPSDELKSASKTSQQSCKEGSGGKGKGQKAKFLRLERKRQKLASRGLNLDEEIAKLKKETCPGVKEIEDFLQPPLNPKLKFEIRHVKVGSDEFSESFGEEHALYQKYQMTIHNDDKAECNVKQFRRFLCDNPLNEVAEDETSGCFHQQYYVDNKLIAVGVVDILPTCLSSVYFFYDPAYMDLTLGTFGALREIAFVRQRSRADPKFQFYYMGFYIHSCRKMRYKGSYTPSYLLCPETYQWKLLDDPFRKALDKTKYLRFFSDTSDGCPHHENINKVAILYRRNIMPYGIYELKRSKDDTKEIQEYCNLVGSELAQNVCLYRSLS